MPEPYDAKWVAPDERTAEEVLRDIVRVARCGDHTDEPPKNAYFGSDFEPLIEEGEQILKRYIFPGESVEHAQPNDRITVPLSIAHGADYPPETGGGNA